MLKNPTIQQELSEAETENKESLKAKLFRLDLQEKDIAFIIEQGQEFSDYPEVLAERLSIKVNIAKSALEEVKSYKIKQVPQKEIDKFKLLVEENPQKRLKEISLLHGIHRDVVSAYLMRIETNQLNENQENAIVEKYRSGFSITEIAEQLKISQEKIKDYVENTFITFNGEEGKIILEIIYKNFETYPITKLKQMIEIKNVKLQEELCRQLPERNAEEYKQLEKYFMKFEGSKDFLEINAKLSIEDKACIRASNLDDVGKLSVKLNRMERVIREYLLQYYPDEESNFDCAQEQLKQIQNMRENFEGEMKISHTAYRMIITDSFDNLIDNANKSSQSPRVILNEILPLAFYYIKCSLPLKELAQIISSMTNIQLTTLDIFHLIFQMSDPVIRGLCIEHYSFSNPVPFYYPILSPNPPEQTSCQFEICKELWYSLQQFSGLVSFGLGWASWNPIGKSHLLDLMFESDFVKGSPQNSPFHLGSIDIQMTKNIFGDTVIGEATQWAHIDCHRCSDIRVIKYICQNIDIALIHISHSDYRENYSRLEEDLNAITVNTKQVYVLVRDCTSNLEPLKVSMGSNKTYSVIFIPNLIKSDQNGTNKKIGYRILHSEIGSSRLVGSSFLERIIDALGSWSNLEKEKEIIETIKDDICTSVQGSSGVDFPFLSYYPHFVEYMRCYYEASSEIDQKVIDELNEKCELLAKHLENAEMSAIVYHFNEILSLENSTLILWKLSQELNSVSKKLIRANSNTSYTIEILWREALLSSKYNAIITVNECRPVSQYLEILSSNFSNHVERGETFELIDGDNLRFFNQDINVLMSQIYKDENDEYISISNENRPPIVVSIFGPQSSGKSTLLNYCFGCKFLTSAGRCTKGIYASLSKLSQPINDSDHFLILDTEGLDSNERGKRLRKTSCINFDRTMVLFCLAVSQVVIINVKGELGEEMQNLLQMCAYSLNKLKVSKVAAPKIFFVLNQQADPDPNKHLNSINILLEKLSEESYLMETDGLKISDLIRVSKENLFVLPSAFNSESLNTQMTKLFDSDLSKLTPTVSFANKCASLRMSIIRQLENNTNDSEDGFSNMVHTYKVPFNTMSEWMEMSGVIWDTIIKYQDIVKYRNTDELKCSNKLSEILSEIMKHKIYFNKEKYRKITEILILQVKKLSSWSSPKVILANNKEDLDKAFESIQEEALEEFALQCKSDSLLKKMDYMCDEARANLCRLIFMEKKVSEDKIKLEIKARLTQIKLTEKMDKFQQVIERNVDEYFDLTIEEQTTEFEGVWISCFGGENKDEEDDELDEKFDNLYSLFRMESKTMQNKQTINTLFRNMKFEMDKIIEDVIEEMLSKFCTRIYNFSETDQFIYPWKENRVPLKEMTPYNLGKEKCEYLTENSLYILETQNTGTILASKANLKFREWVPSDCHPLIKYCSGYYNHPDIIWKLEKRKQILYLASQLKDPNDLSTSTWKKVIHDLSIHVQEFTKRDPSISHSTVKEIVDFLYQFCKLVNYEINFIEAKLTNAAERTISTLAFTFAFKSLLETKFEKQRDEKLNARERKENDLKYFLQKIENRKLARGNWDRKEMRKSDLIMANKFAADFLAALCRGISTEFERSINEEYFEKEAGRFSHKNILLLANKRVTEVLRQSSILTKKEKFLALNFYFLNMAQKRSSPAVRPDISNLLLKDHSDLSQSFDENSFVVQFICDRIQTLKNIFHGEWRKLSTELYRRINRDMKDKFIKQISIVKDVLNEFLKVLVGMCTQKSRLLEVGTDSDSNFEVANGEAAEESACESDPKKREAPFKAMVLFLEKYLNPKVSPEEFNQFFTSTFGVDGVKMIKHHDTYVLFEKTHHPGRVLDEEIFKMLTDTNMFRSTETIFNIKVYIETFLCALNYYEYKLTEAEYESILKNTKQQFEANIINCRCQCPSCGKLCEKEVHPHGGKCQILTGHQFCSMGGQVWNSNEGKTAILLMCEDYKEDSPVLIPGQNMKWSEFKEKCGDQWDWTLPTEKGYVTLQKENHDKMKMIWKRFGIEILKYYAIKGTQITCIPYTHPEEIYKSLFGIKYYICFVIDGTNLMRGTIGYAKKWVKEAMRHYQLEGSSNFKVIVYHGHHCLKFVKKFPNNSEFTSDDKSIEKFLKNVTTSADGKNEFPMLHGLATAAKESDWKSGFGIQNIIIHFYIEPTNGHFNIFTAKGKCEQGCQFDWERDIRDRKSKMKIEYKRKRLISSSHPKYDGTTPVNDKTTGLTFKSKRKSKTKSEIFINYKTDN